MLQALFDFYHNVFTSNMVSTSYIYKFFNTNTTIQLFGTAMNFHDYFCSACAIVTMVFILILCYLFIFKLIKVVARLFSGGAL